MFKVKNIFKKPVFVEGVHLGNHESIEVETITEGIMNLKNAKMISIERISVSTKESNSVEVQKKVTEVLTEEGSSEFNKRRKKSSKTLNE